MSDSTWVTSHFAPALGTLLANIMWVSPMKAVIDARKVNDLGALNPIPFAVTLINCIGWSMYGIMKSDYYIFFGNCFGIVISLSYCISSLMLLSKSDSTKDQEWFRSTVEYMVVGGVCTWIFIILIVGLILRGGGPSDMFVGILCDIVSISYYAAPLSTLFNVIKTKDSSSLYVPTICANLLNGVMWTVYGLIATHDILLWVPNGIGTLLAIIQLMVKSIYGSIFSCTTSTASSHSAAMKSIKRDSTTHMLKSQGFDSYHVDDQPIHVTSSLAPSVPSSTSSSKPGGSGNLYETKESDFQHMRRKHLQYLKRKKCLLLY